MKTVYTPTLYIKTLMVAGLWIIALVIVSLLKYTNFDPETLKTFPLIDAFLKDKSYIWLVAFLIVDTATNDLCKNNNKMQSSLWLVIVLIITTIIVYQFNYAFLFWLWIVIFLSIKTTMLVKQHCFKE